MKSFLMFIATIIIIIVIPKTLDIVFGKKKLESEISLLKCQLETATLIIRRNNEVIENMVRNAARYSPFSCADKSISKDEIDAVKYAMKHSHPDNGGDTEDFKRFRKVYEELTGRRC